MPGVSKSLTRAETKLFPMGIFALDDIALDVFGSIYASIVSGPFAVAKVDDGNVSTVGAFSASVLSLAFGTGRGARESLFVATNQKFGGTGSAIFRANVKVPGHPIP